MSSLDIHAPDETPMQPTPEFLSLWEVRRRRNRPRWHYTVHLRPRGSVDGRRDGYETAHEAFFAAMQTYNEACRTMKERPDG